MEAPKLTAEELEEVEEEVADPLGPGLPIDETEADLE